MSYRKLYRSRSEEEEEEENRCTYSTLDNFQVHNILLEFILSVYTYIYNIR